MSRMAEIDRVFITGGGSGLGRALALCFAAEGARVGLGDVHDERLEETAEAVAEAGGEPLALRCDITSDEQVAEAAAAVRASWGGIDVLVNNAGVAAAGTVLDTTMEDWRWMLEINLLGAVRVTHAFLPMMEEAKSGHVINVASAAGIVQSPGMASYNVAKAGMIALSETLRAEVAGYGVGVTVVCPSFFTTNLMESYRGPNEGARDLAAKLMDRSRLDAGDIAAAIVRGYRSEDFFVFGHNEARMAYHLKRFFPGLFRWSTERAGQRLFGRFVQLEPSGQDRN
jgi:NAD(P)-dependent dehydrogenase (short-subunit alcohol dehydrogenase family)